jgi:hypothetical protein
LNLKIRDVRVSDISQIRILRSGRDDDREIKQRRSVTNDVSTFEYFDVTMNTVEVIGKVRVNHESNAFANVQFSADTPRSDHTLA